MKRLILLGMLIGVYFVLTGSLAAQDETVTVISIKANLRGTPDSKGAIVTTVDQNDVFELIKTKGAWYLVQTPKFVGWLHGNSIRLNDSPSIDNVETVPKTTTAPLTTEGDTPFQSEYVGGDRTVIYVTNAADITMNLTFGGAHYFIPSGESRTIEVAGGDYDFLATGTGVRSKSGVRRFNRGYKYTWKFYIVTSVR